MMNAGSGGLFANLLLRNNKCIDFSHHESYTLFPMRGPTQADIARALGLSQATVGLALAEKPSPLQLRLRRETIEKVREKARKMGYRPHRAAREMRCGRSNLIVHLNFSGYTEMAARRSFHLGRLMHESGFDFRSVEAYWWISDPERVIDQILSLHPEAVIVSGSVQAPFNLEHIQTLHRRKIPVVTIGFQVPGVSSVVYDARGAFRDLTRHCLEAGSRRPVLVLRRTPFETGWQTLAKGEGFREVLEAAGGTLEDGGNSRKGANGGAKVRGAVFWDTGVRTSHAFHDGGLQAMAEMSEWSQPPDAVICSNDTYAIGVLNYCVRFGVAVPESCMITGFDNIAGIRSLPRTITTIEQPIEAVCQQAMDLLREELGRKSRSRRSAVQIVVPCGAILPGESTGQEHAPDLSHILSKQTATNVWKP